MSKAEILAELTRLSPRDRSEILEELWRLEEAAGPTPAEKAILREAQEAYEKVGDAGSPWPEVQARLRKRS
jgi:putative addiction module component (TIGR02574 family)